MNMRRGIKGGEMPQRWVHFADREGDWSATFRYVALLTVAAYSTLSAVSARAQQPSPLCPSPVQLQQTKKSNSYQGTIDLLKGIISGIQGGVATDTETKPVLQQFPNASLLLLKIDYYSPQCNLIVTDSTLTPEQKRQGLQILYQEIFLDKSPSSVAPVDRSRVDTIEIVSASFDNQQGLGCNEAKQTLGKLCDGKLVCKFRGASNVCDPPRDPARGAPKYFSVSVTCGQVSASLQEKDGRIYLVQCGASGLISVSDKW